MIRASRKIHAGEEIFLAYGRAFPWVNDKPDDGAPTIPIVVPAEMPVREAKKRAKALRSEKPPAPAAEFQQLYCCAPGCKEELSFECTFCKGNLCWDHFQVSAKEHECPKASMEKQMQARARRQAAKAAPTRGIRQSARVSKRAEPIPAEAESASAPKPKKRGRPGRGELVQAGDDELRPIILDTALLTCMQTADLPIYRLNMLRGDQAPKQYGTWGETLRYWICNCGAMDERRNPTIDWCPTCNTFRPDMSAEEQEQYENFVSSNTRSKKSAREAVGPGEQQQRPQQPQPRGSGVASSAVAAVSAVAEVEQGQRINWSQFDYDDEEQQANNGGGALEDGADELRAAWSPGGARAVAAVGVAQGALQQGEQSLVGALASENVYLSAAEQQRRQEGLEEEREQLEAAHANLNAPRVPAGWPEIPALRPVPTEAQSAAFQARVAAQGPWEMFLAARPNSLEQIRRHALWMDAPLVADQNAGRIMRDERALVEAPVIEEPLPCDCHGMTSKRVGTIEEVNKVYRVAVRKEGYCRRNTCECCAPLPDGMHQHAKTEQGFHHWCSCRAVSDELCWRCWVDFNRGRQSDRNRFLLPHAFHQTDVVAKAAVPAATQ